MLSRHAVRVAAVLAAPLAFGACATKGYVRDQIAVSRTATDSALAAEQRARVAADNEMNARIASLRTDLDSLRTQFGARISLLEDGIRFAMPVNFAFDDASVRATDRPMLERFATVASKYYAGSAITIEGFADPAGTESYNVALSRRRAESVRMALRSLGLTRNPMRTIGYGEARQVSPGAEKNEPGAELNRRVVFVIETAGSEANVALGPTP